jgi:hypothetical protein
MTNMTKFNVSRRFDGNPPRVRVQVVALHMLTSTHRTTQFTVLQVIVLLLVESTRVS